MSSAKKCVFCKKSEGDQMGRHPITKKEESYHLACWNRAAADDDAFFVAIQNDAEPESEPEELSYRIDSDTIDRSVCVGRCLVDEDRRWKPIIYYEVQCGGKPILGSDLCKKCYGRQEKFYDTGKQKDWNGRITEEPLPGTHMIGTQWAIEKKLAFRG